MIHSNPLSNYFGQVSGSRRISLLVLATVALVFLLAFVAKGMLLHGNFNTSAYDLGIFDQAFWRYSRFLDQFNTVRGLPILGDHFSPIGLFFAPLYGVFPSVFWPIAFQSLSVALGGMVLYLVATERLPGVTSLPLLLAIGYLLHPAVHNTLLWQYHDLVLASGLYMGLIWSYLRQRWTLYIVIVVLLLACREDMPVTVAAFGVLALIEKRWRYGVAAIVLAVLWWLMAVKWLMPVFNGQGYFRHVHGTIGPLLANLLTPRFYVDRVSDPQSLTYLWQLLFPFGFLAILSPRFLLPALPTTAVNILIGGYNTDIGYHYNVSIMPFMFWGAVETLHRYRHLIEPDAGANTFRRRVLVLVLCAASAWSYFHHSTLKLHRFPDLWRSWSDNGPKRELLGSLDKELANQGIATSDFLLPHLSHRELIYLFPNPWKSRYWGIAGEKPHHPNAVDAIIIESDYYAQTPELLDYLVDSGIFQREPRENGILVFRRVQKEADNRDAALEGFQQYLSRGMEFAELAISPVFATAESEFRRVDIALDLVQKGVPKDWRNLNLAGPKAILDIDLTQGHAGNFSTRYLRAVVNAEQTARAILALGSDDGVTVWLNGERIHENIVNRPARPGDDRVAVNLARGKNVLVFRVNNAGGAWRLLARLHAPRSTDERK